MIQVDKNFKSWVLCSDIQHILLVKNSNIFSAEFVDVKCMHTYIPLSRFNYEDIVNTPWWWGVELIFYSDYGRYLMEEQCDCMLTLI